jgi:hypothetical protein
MSPLANLLENAIAFSNRQNSLSDRMTRAFVCRAKAVVAIWPAITGRYRLPGITFATVYLLREASRKNRKSRMAVVRGVSFRIFPTGGPLSKAFSPVGSFDSQHLSKGSYSVGA